MLFIAYAIAGAYFSYRLRLLSVLTRFTISQCCVRTFVLYSNHYMHLQQLSMMPAFEKFPVQGMM